MEEESNKEKFEFKPEVKDFIPAYGFVNFCKRAINRTPEPLNLSMSLYSLFIGVYHAESLFYSVKGLAFGLEKLIN